MDCCSDIHHVFNLRPSGPHQHQLSSKTKAAGSDLVIVQLLQKHCSGQRPRPPGPITKKAPAACVGTLSSPCRDQCAVLPGPRTRSCCLSNLTLSFCLSTKSCFVKKYGYLATLRPQMLLHVLFPAVHMTVNQDLMDRLWQVYVRKCVRRVPDVPYCIVHTVARKGLVADHTLCGVCARSPPAKVTHSRFSSRLVACSCH